MCAEAESSVKLKTRGAISRESPPPHKYHSNYLIVVMINTNNIYIYIYIYMVDIALHGYFPKLVNFFFDF